MKKIKANKFNDIINEKNRAKYARYKELLWNFAYAANTPECRHIIDSKLVQSCFDEHWEIDKALSIWNDKWKDIDFKSMVQVGEYYHVRKLFPNFETEVYSICHVTDIRKTKRSDIPEEYEIEYECLTAFRDHSIVARGKNLKYTRRYNNVNEFMMLKPFCGYILDGKSTKTDENEWNALYAQLESMSSEIDKYDKEQYGNEE